MSTFAEKQARRKVFPQEMVIVSSPDRNRAIPTSTISTDPFSKYDVVDRAL